MNLEGRNVDVERLERTLEIQRRVNRYRSDLQAFESNGERRDQLSELRRITNQPNPRGHRSLERSLGLDKDARAVKRSIENANRLRSMLRRGTVHTVKAS